MKVEAAGFFLWCSLFLTLKIQSSFCAVITSPPQSVTVPLKEERVNFTCKGTGDALIWLVASGSPTSPLNQERDITVTDINTVPGNLSSVLTMAVLPINNRVEITCQIISFSNPSEPDTSGCTLTIRGISPVDSMQWFTETQTLSWSAPFFSDDIPQGEPLVYSVLVDGISINTTDTSIELTSSLVSLVNVSCTNFNVSITASAYVYVSEEKQEVIDNTGNYTVHIDNKNSNFNFDRTNDTFNIELTNTINCTAQSCNNTIIGKLTPDEGIVQDKHYIITDEEHETFSYTFIGLKPCLTYVAEIDILNSFDKFEGRDTTTIVTSQVQDVLVSSEGYTNGSVNVQCVFVSGSTADGCHVIFTDTTNGRNESFNITGSDNTMISLSTSGHYNVTVYDILDRIIIPWLCLQPKEVTVTSVIPISTTSTLPSNSVTSATNLISSFSVSAVMTPSVSGETKSSGGTTGNNTMIYIISGLIGACVLALFVIIPLCVIICKRQVRKKRVVLNAEHADCHQPQAKINRYEDLPLVRTIPVATATIGITSPLLTPITTDESREAMPPNMENPYHVTADEISAIRNARQDNSPATTTTIPSIEEQYHNNLGASPYLDNHETYLSSPTPSTSSTDPNDAVNVTSTMSKHTSDNKAIYAAVAFAETKTPVNPPTGVQPVLYSNITGDITKRGEIAVYSDNNNTTTADHDDVHITIDFESKDSTEAPSPPPPPYEEITQDDSSSLEATISHPQEISQPSFADTQFVPSVQKITAADHPIVHNSAQYGIKSDTFDYEGSVSLDSHDPNSTANILEPLTTCKSSMENQLDGVRCPVSVGVMPTPSPPVLSFISYLPCDKNESHNLLIEDDKDEMQAKTTQHHNADHYGIMVIKRRPVKKCNNNPIAVPAISLKYKPVSYVDDVNNEALYLSCEEESNFAQNEEKVESNKKMRSESMMTLVNVLMQALRLIGKKLFI